MTFARSSDLQSREAGFTLAGRFAKRMKIEASELAPLVASRKMPIDICLIEMGEFVNLSGAEPVPDSGHCGPHFDRLTVGNSFGLDRDQSEFGLHPPVWILRPEKRSASLVGGRACAFWRVGGGSGARGLLSWRVYGR